MALARSFPISHFEFKKASYSHSEGSFSKALLSSSTSLHPEHILKFTSSDEKPGSIGRRSLLLSWLSDDDLLGYGVPAEWLPDVRSATEDTLLKIADHLPGEAAEALLELATGGKPRVQQIAATNPFEHPDALRRFRVMESVEELARALDYRPATSQDAPRTSQAGGSGNDPRTATGGFAGGRWP